MKPKTRENKKTASVQKKTQDRNDNSQKQKKDQEERTFSDWLRSDEGIENLKLFVLGNSILVFIAISWPHIKESLDAAYYLYLDYTKN